MCTDTTFSTLYSTALTQQTCADTHKDMCAHTDTHTHYSHYPLLLQMLSMEEKLLKRERFIVTLAEKLAEYQAKERQTQQTSPSDAQSQFVVREMDREHGLSREQHAKEETWRTRSQESTDVRRM